MTPRRRFVRRWQIICRVCHLAAKFFPPAFVGHLRHGKTRRFRASRPPGMQRRLPTPVLTALKVATDAENRTETTDIGLTREIFLARRSKLDLRPSAPCSSCLIPNRVL